MCRRLYYNADMKASVIKQYSIFMPNQPGALARLALAFGESDVNIVGIASEVRDDSGLVRIAVESGVSVSGVLSRAGFASVEGKLLSLEIDDKPGKLAEVAGLLADAGINITTIYGTALSSQVCRMLIAVDDTDEAMQVLEAL